MFGFNSLSIWHIYFIATLTVLPNASLLPILPELADRFGFPGDQFSAYVMVAPAVGVAVASPIMTRVLPTGIESLILMVRVSALLYAIFGIVPFLVSDFILIYSSRIGLGLCISLFHVASFRIITKCMIGSRRKGVLGRQSGITNIGGITFVFLSTALASWSWSYPFLLPCLALIVLVPTFRWQQMRENSCEANSTIGDNIRPSRDFVLFCAFVALVGAFAMCVVYTLTTIVPFQMAQFSDSPRLANSITLAITTVCSAVIGLTFGRLPFSIPALLTAAFIWLSIYAAGCGISTTSFGLYCSCGALGIGLGLIVPAMSEYIAKIVKEKPRSHAFSLLTSSLFVGQFLSPLISSALASASDGTRAATMIGWSIASAAVGFMVLLLLHFWQPLHRVNCDLGSK